MRTRAQRTGVLCVAAALAFVAGGSTQSAATPQRTAAAAAVSLDGGIAQVRFTPGGVLHGNPNPACGGAPFLSANALGAGAVQVEQFSPAASGLALAPPSNTFGSVFFGSSEDAVRQLGGLLDLTVAATGLRVSLHFTVVGGDCTHGMAESRQYVAGAGLTTPPSAGFQPIANACGTGQFTRPAASTYEVELSLVSCPSSPPTNPGCAPYIVIDSRGSGSNEVVSAPGKKFLDELRRLKAPQYVGVIRTEYPAVGWTSFLGAVLQLPAGYYKSVSTGSTWLRAKLASEIKLCGPKTKFFL